MGVSNNITTLRGWSEQGKRSYAEQIGFATERVNIVAGYIPETKQLVAPLEHTGNMNKDLFNQWVNDYLVSERKGHFLKKLLKNGECQRLLFA
jgi:hypothetical protein